MRLLLDTPVLLWALLDDPRLTATQAQAISTGEVYLSAVTAWEIGVMRADGSLDVPETLIEVALDAGCKPLPVTLSHAAAAAKLPPYHADLFDRMLIAQAQCEGLLLVSAEKKLAQYEVTLLV